MVGLYLDGNLQTELHDCNYVVEQPVSRMQVIGQSPSYIPGPSTITGSARMETMPASCNVGGMGNTFEIRISNIDGATGLTHTSTISNVYITAITDIQARTFDFIAESINYAEPSIPTDAEIEEEVERLARAQVDAVIEAEAKINKRMFPDEREFNVHEAF